MRAAALARAITRNVASSHTASWPNCGSIETRGRTISEPFPVGTKVQGFQVDAQDAQKLVILTLHRPPRGKLPVIRYPRRFMFRIAFGLLLSAFAFTSLDAQAPDLDQKSSELDGSVRIGPGVTPPHVLRKVDPKYSAEGRVNHIQGTVILELAITEKGRPVGIRVLSPLGFGLDEIAQAAVEKWEFSPGMKDGKPVKILVTIEVNFRFLNAGFDEKTERQRTSFNLALQACQRSGTDAMQLEKAVKSMQDLSRLEFPPAMNLVGHWKLAGDYVPEDPSDGLALIQKAAAKNYGPALYEVAIRHIEGRDLPLNATQGLEMMRHASVVGSQSAQAYLGDLYEKGSGVPRELDRARRYFRLCAAQGVAGCQYRIGRLLLESPDRPERDYVQGVAWLQLAGERGNTEAREIASREGASLTRAQITWIATLKAQLVHK
jgi:TonB family protein